jgi:hypothetical protein
MTALELKQLLADVPDDMKVLVAVEDQTKPGMFAFAEACTCDTGVSKLGPDEHGEGGGEEVFLVLPHGFGATDEENGEAVIPELN